MPRTSAEFGRCGPRAPLPRTEPDADRTTTSRTSRPTHRGVNSSGPPCDGISRPQGALGCRWPRGQDHRGALPGDSHWCRRTPPSGDLRGNADLVVGRTREAAAGGACLVVFPEMFLTGYPVEDLALRKSFIEASQRALDRARHAPRAAPSSGDLVVVVGYLDAARRPRRSARAAASLPAECSAR